RALPRRRDGDDARSRSARGGATGRGRRGDAASESIRSSPSRGSKLDRLTRQRASRSARDRIRRGGYEVPPPEPPPEVPPVDDHEGGMKEGAGAGSGALGAALAFRFAFFGALFFAATRFFFLRAGAAFFPAFRFLVFDFAFFAFFAIDRLPIFAASLLTSPARRTLPPRWIPVSRRAPRVRGLRSPSRSTRRCGPPGSWCPPRSATCCRYCWW